jgi:hypothetical protein
LLGPFFEEPFSKWAVGANNEYIYNEDGKQPKIEIGANTRDYDLFKNTSIVVVPIIFIAVPFVVYLFGLIYLACR